MGKDNNYEIRLKNLVYYGLGDLYGGGAFLVLGTLYMIYLTDVVGLPPGRAGLVLIIGKIWDAISDPLMGHISDNTKSRLGRRRIYFLIGIIPIALSFFLLWYPVNFNSTKYIFYYYVFAYIFFSTVFTMVMVPYTALNTEMSEDYKERTKLSTFRMLFSQFSALLAGVLPRLIVDYFSDNVYIFSNIEGQKLGFMVMGIIFGIFYAIPWLFVFKGTWELPTNKHKREEKLSQKLKSYTTVFENKAFQIHLAMYICAYVAMDFLMALFVYYLNYYMQLPGLYSFCMLALLLSQIIMLPIYMKISNKKGKGFAYIIGLSLWGIAMLPLLFLSSSTPIWIVILICILIGSGLSAGVMIPWAILPSVTDVDEVITLKKRTGVYAGVMTLVRKTAQAIAMWSVGYLLSLIGYIPNQPQSPSTLLWLKLIFVFLPIVLIGSGIFFANKFKICPTKHDKLIKEIKRLRSGGKRKNVDPAVKRLCEDLSGKPYSS